MSVSPVYATYLELAMGMVRNEPLPEPEPEP